MKFPSIEHLKKVCCIMAYSSFLPLSVLQACADDEIRQNSSKKNSSSYSSSYTVSSVSFDSFPSDETGSLEIVSSQGTQNLYSGPLSPNRIELHENVSYGTHYQFYLTMDAMSTSKGVHIKKLSDASYLPGPYRLEVTYYKGNIFGTLVPDKSEA